MNLHPVSLAAVGCIALTIGVALWRRWPATGVLIAGNVVLFLICLASPTIDIVFQVDGQPFLLQRAIVREQLLLDSSNLLHPNSLGALQLLTHQFLHADVLHLLGNMLMLFFLGLPFEERIGARKFTAIYLFAGLAGALSETFYNYPDPVRLVGASGAVAGIIGAFAVTHPNQQVPMPVPALFITFFVRMRVWIAAIVFLAAQFVYLYLFAGADNTAYIAHVGGLLGGALLAFLIARPKGRGASGGQGPVPINLQGLAPFANDPTTQRVLLHMRTNHDEPAVFQAWLDRFFATATCPKCAHKVAPHHRGEVVCTQGHRFDVRQQAL